MIFSVYSISESQLGHAQTENWKKYNDPGQKFTFLYPPDWVVNGTRHNNVNGYTEVTLTNPNSTRMKVSVIYNPKDSSLDPSNGKPVVLSKALADLEDQLVWTISTSTVPVNSLTNIPFKTSHLQVMW